MNAGRDAAHFSPIIGNGAFIFEIMSAMVRQRGEMVISPRVANAGRAKLPDSEPGSSSNIRS